MTQSAVSPADDGSGAPRPVDLDAVVIPGPWPQKPTEPEPEPEQLPAATTPPRPPTSAGVAPVSRGRGGGMLPNWIPVAVFFAAIAIGLVLRAWGVTIP